MNLLTINGRNEMNFLKFFKILLTSVFFMIFSFVANADKEIKIGVIFDYTGPLAGGGSDLQALGVKIVIDHFNKQGGVEGYKINAVYADAQSCRCDSLISTLTPRIHEKLMAYQSFSRFGQLLGPDDHVCIDTSNHNDLVFDACIH